MTCVCGRLEGMRKGTERKFGKKTRQGLIQRGGEGGQGSVKHNSLNSYNMDLKVNLMFLVLKYVQNFIKI